MIKKPLWKMSGGCDLKKEFGEIIETSFIDLPIVKESRDYNKIFPLKKDTRELIINAVVTDPLDVSLETLLLNGRSICFIEWLIWLGAQHTIKTHIVIDKEYGHIINLINEKTDICHIHIYPVTAKYPQDNAKIIAKTVFGKHFPNLLEKTEIIHIRDLIRAFYKNEALIGKNDEDIVSIAIWNDISDRWEKIIRRGKQKFGVWSDDVLNGWLNYAQNHNYRFIAGGLMTGREITPEEIAPKEFDITKITLEMSPIVIIPRGDTRDFLPNFTKRLIPCVTTNLCGEKRECINCNWCDEVCPMKLCVKNIYESIRQERFKEAERLGLFECVECGLCDYKCPAKIEIMETIRKAKKIVSGGGESND